MAALPPSWGSTLPNGLFMRILFLFFVVTPILEIWLLLKVGAVIGTLPTVGLVVFTAVLGAGLLKQQGLSTLLRAQERLNSGQLPATEILEGLFLAVGGALLLTPGFATDALGFACLLPPLRQRLIKAMLARGLVQAQQRGFEGGFGPGPDYRQEPRPEVRRDADGHYTIDGDYRRED